jgi:hypothetical protein
VTSCHSLVVVLYPPCPFPCCAPCCHYHHSTCNPPHEELLIGLEVGGALSSVIHHLFIIICHHLFVILHHLLGCHLSSFICHHLLLFICHHLSSFVCHHLSSVVCRLFVIISCLSIGIYCPYLSALQAVAHSSRGRGSYVILNIKEICLIS